MRYLALAADFDGTLAHDGAVAANVIAGLEQLSASGRKLILVTGRELDELLGIFPQITLFDRVVAENGALLYLPATRERKPLTASPPQKFISELLRRGVEPLSVGTTIVATVQPNETIVLEVIRDLGLELQVIFNKGAVMILPAGVNKASGLAVALHELGLSAHNVVAVGDGENDHALLDSAEYSMAVANAIPMLKEAADRVSVRTHGEGALELINDLLDNDLARTPPRTLRRKLVLGTDLDGNEIAIAPAGSSLLVAGTSGSGKSTLATGVLERLVAQHYQICIIDPEGDYEDFADAVIFGSSQRGPGVAEVLTALEKPDVNVVVNLIGLPLQDRPEFFLSLLPRLFELRLKTGRPHWILVDEAHHLLPADHQSSADVFAQDPPGMIYVTVHPDWVAPHVLNKVDIVALLGAQPAETLEQFCRIAGFEVPVSPSQELSAGQALLWRRCANGTPLILNVAPSHTERRRHRRKYAEGELPPERSFFFRGPAGKLNLRAQNLMLFNQLADGVDDETWIHHLSQHDYSQWMRACIKDDALADAVQAIESETKLDAQESRRLIRAAVEERYTLPASVSEHG